VFIAWKGLALKPVYTVLLVPSAQHAVRAEKVLLDAGLVCKLIPVPRQIASDCGVCVRVVQSETEKARRILAQAGLEVEGVHRLL